MAATKKPKSTKSMDMKNPKTTKPSHTARPVIVSNRPMIKDPMVHAADVPATDLDEPSTSPILPKVTAKIITPTESAAPSEPTNPSSDTAPELDAQQVPQLVKSAQKEKAAEIAKQVTEDAAVVPEKPADMAEKKDAKLSTEPTDQDDAKDTPEETQSPDENASEDAEDASDSTEPELDAPASPDQPDEMAKADAEEAKLTARAEHIQELMEDKTYFLPIKTSAKNSTKAGVLVLLIAAAAAAGYYYMFTQR